MSRDDLQYHNSEHKLRPLVHDLRICLDILKHYEQSIFIVISSGPDIH